MATFAGRIDHQRLCDAADALLAALASPEGARSKIVVQLEPPVADRSTPPGVFTTSELEEAARMLIRLGLRPAAPERQPV